MYQHSVITIILCVGIQTNSPCVNLGGTKNNPNKASVLNCWTRCGFMMIQYGEMPMRFTGSSVLKKNPSLPKWILLFMNKSSISIERICQLYPFKNKHSIQFVVVVNSRHWIAGCVHDSPICILHGKTAVCFVISGMGFQTRIYPSLTLALAKLAVAVRRRLWLCAFGGLAHMELGWRT